MAELKLGFAKFNPGAGNGDQAVQVSADEYKGRVQRTMTAQVATAEGSVTKQVVVNQAAIAEFVTIDKTASVGKEGGSITISGRSNSTKLAFTVNADSENPLVITLPAKYTAAGKETDNNVAIADDPGATGDYEFSIVIAGIPANVTVNDLISTLTVTAEGGQADSTVITQTAGDPTLDVDVEVINLDAAGTAQTLNVTSNTNWTITQVVARMFKAFKK